MPQHKSAKKRLRQNKKRQEANRSRRSKLRTLVRKVLESTEKEQAEKNLQEATSYIDRASTKGILHENTAARKKSRMTRHVNSL